MTPLHCVFLQTKALCVNHCWAIRHLKALSDTSQNSATFLSFWLFCIILLFFPSIWIVVETNKGNCRSFIPITPKVIGPLSKAGLIYQCKDGYWNCSAGHKSGQRISLLSGTRPSSLSSWKKRKNSGMRTFLVALLMDMTPLDPWMTSSPGVESHQGLVIRVILYLFQLHLLQVNANR